MDHEYFIRCGIFSLYNIKRTQIEMLRDRGYVIPKSEQKILNMTEKQFDKYHKKLTEGTITNEWTPYLDEMILPDNVKYTERTVLGNTYVNENNNKKCIVIYIDQEGGLQVVKSITDAILVMIEGINTGIKYDEAILITHMPFSVCSRSSINDLKYTKHWIFNDYELRINVTKHVYVPEHRLATEVETREFKRMFKHPELISIQDPIVKYYGWSVGDVVVIKRDISSIDSMVKYMIAKRLIVEANNVSSSKK